MKRKTKNTFKNAVSLYTVRHMNLSIMNHALKGKINNGPGERNIIELYFLRHRLA